MKAVLSVTTVYCRGPECDLSVEELLVDNGVNWSNKGFYVPQIRWVNLPLNDVSCSRHLTPLDRARRCVECYVERAGDQCTLNLCFTFREVAAGCGRPAARTASRPAGQSAQTGKKDTQSFLWEWGRDRAAGSRNGESEINESQEGLH